ncbi:MAG: undecaprenyl-diphosphate phosphatase, partial [Saprospiraceae bacterium]|nr:undecaprenyl-diphosphate phosphatase [Saprospiraceae bacterium]
MEDLLRAVLVGVIQGLTEFLPVSSSGHIELGQAILGLDYGKYEQQFSVILHAATALSTIVVFRNDIAKILLGLFQKDKIAWSFSMKIILSMIPAAIIGIAFEEQLDALFNGKILLVGSMLLLTGVLLFLADRAR